MKKTTTFLFFVVSLFFSVSHATWETVTISEYPSMKIDSTYHKKIVAYKAKHQAFKILYDHLDQSSTLNTSLLITITLPNLDAMKGKTVYGGALIFPSMQKDFIAKFAEVDGFEEVFNEERKKNPLLFLPYYVFTEEGRMYDVDMMTVMHEMLHALQYQELLNKKQFVSFKQKTVEYTKYLKWAETDAVLLEYFVGDIDPKSKGKHDLLKTTANLEKVRDLFFKQCIPDSKVEAEINTAVNSIWENVLLKSGYREPVAGSAGTITWKSLVGLQKLYGIPKNKCT